MNIPLLKFSPCLLLMGFSVLAQTPPSTPAMRTYSPYSAEQLKELNSQPLSPVEGPFGPIQPNGQNMTLPRQASPDAKYYYRQPEGEEEAEVLETQSAELYQPSSPVIPF